MYAENVQPTPSSGKLCSMLLEDFVPIIGHNLIL